MRKDVAIGYLNSMSDVNGLNLRDDVKKFVLDIGRSIFDEDVDEILNPLHLRFLNVLALGGEVDLIHELSLLANQYVSTSFGYALRGERSKTTVGMFSKKLGPGCADIFQVEPETNAIMISTNYASGGGVPGVFIVANRKIVGTEFAVSDAQFGGDHLTLENLIISGNNSDLRVLDSEMVRFNFKDGRLNAGSIHNSTVYLRGDNELNIAEEAKGVDFNSDTSHGRSVLRISKIVASNFDFQEGESYVYADSVYGSILNGFIDLNVNHMYGVKTEVFGNVQVRLSSGCKFIVCGNVEIFEDNGSEFVMTPGSSLKIHNVFGSVVDVSCFPGYPRGDLSSISGLKEKPVVELVSIHSGFTIKKHSSDVGPSGFCF